MVPGMRSLALFSIIGLLGGCSNAEDRACDEAIKSTLKAPASYKRVSKRGSRVEYDAVNSFNAPIRGHGICYYDAATGRALWAENDPNS